jgi:hypothetical protein
VKLGLIIPSLMANGEVAALLFRRSEERWLVRRYETAGAMSPDQHAALQRLRSRRNDRP